MIRVAVTGGRDYTDTKHIFDTLDEVHREHGISVLIEGEGNGLDIRARVWAEYRGIPFKPYPADWKQLGKGAGPVRNQTMVDAGKPDLLVRFNGGTGTADMTRRCINSGVPVRWA